MKMLSLSLFGHKNEAPKVLSAFEASFMWIFNCNDVFVCVSTWENIFSTKEDENGFQLGRITLDFSKHGIKYYDYGKS